MGRCPKKNLEISDNLNPEQKGAIRTLIKNWMNLQNLEVKKIKFDSLANGYVGFLKKEIEKKYLPSKNFRWNQSGARKKIRVVLDDKVCNVVLIKLNSISNIGLSFKLWMYKIYEIYPNDVEKFLISFVWCAKGINNDDNLRKMHKSNEVVLYEIKTNDDKCVGEVVKVAEVAEVNKNNIGGDTIIYDKEGFREKEMNDRFLIQYNELITPHDTLASWLMNM